MSLKPNSLRCKVPLQWVGGKSEMADWITGHFPKHQTYVESYGGAAGVLLWKEPSPIEVYNDLDHSLVNFFTQCRDRPDDLASLLLFSPYSRSEYERCKHPLLRVVNEENPARPEHDLEDARRFAVVARQSMGGVWGRAWSKVVTHSRRGMASGNSRWLNLPTDVLAVAARMASVQIECREATDLFEMYDRPTTLFYLDPPYDPDTRDAGLYRFEMDKDKHGKLLNILQDVQGYVVLSGYDSDGYNVALPTWRVEKREVTCRSNVNSQGGIADRPTRTECLWMNFNRVGKRL